MARSTKRASIVGRFERQDRLFAFQAIMGASATSCVFTTDVLMNTWNVVRGR